MSKFSAQTNNAAETKKLGELIGKNLHGGEVFEFLSDLGGGKTTFVGGLASGFGSSDPVSSPSFTISYVYKRADKKELHHFDFYRLSDPGVVAAELAEVIHDHNVVVAVEWGEIVENVLPSDRVKVHIAASSEESRSITFEYPESLAYIFNDLKENA